MFVAWLPFLYAELTREEAEGKDRELPAVDEDDVHAEAVPVAEAEEVTQEPGEDDDPTAAVADEAPEEVPSEPGAAVAQAPSAADEPEGVPEAPSEADEEDQGDEEGESEPKPPLASGPVTVLRQAFERQPRDALWADDTEHTLRGLFGTADVPAELLSKAACRSSVCRVDVKWSPAQATAYVGVFEASSRLSGHELGIEPVGEVDEDGSQHVQLYVTRKGYTMADLAR
jgi:hypothetical protein